MQKVRDLLEVSLHDSRKSTAANHLNHFPNFRSLSRLLCENKAFSQGVPVLTFPNHREQQGEELLASKMETAKVIIQQMGSRNNSSELMGTEVFSFHDHTGIPQKQSKQTKQNCLGVGKQGTGTLYQNRLARARLIRITRAFLNFLLSSTRDVKRARKTGHSVFF